MDWTCSKNGQGRRVKKTVDSKTEGSRRRGRPKLKWLEHVEKGDEC